MSNPVDAWDGFFGVPGCADFAVRVASVEETTQADLTPVAVSSRGQRGEEPPYPIQRVTLAAAMAEGFVLGAAS